MPTVDDSRCRDEAREPLMWWTLDKGRCTCAVSCPM